MPASGNQPASLPFQLDVVLLGTWVIVPSADATGRIAQVDVYSPACGHPQGVFFTDQFDPVALPDSSAFHMLDNHGHNLAIQRSSGMQAGMPVSAIPQASNHCLGKRRPMGTNWDLQISISAGPDTWISSEPTTPTFSPAPGQNVPCFSGQDAPSGDISFMQTLAFKSIGSVEFCGAPADVQSLLPADWAKGGALIFENEIPYIPTLQHERAAIQAMAILAGLDLALDHPLPRKTSPPAPGPNGGPIARLRTGGYCGHSLIVL